MISGLCPDPRVPRVLTLELKMGLKGAVFGAIGAGLANGIGTLGETMVISWGMPIAKAGKAVLHGLSRALISKAQGGKWSAGFWSGFAGSALAPLSGYASTSNGKMAISAIVGGTASKLGGGKFANGAVSAAFVHMYNYKAHLPKWAPPKSTERTELIPKILNNSVRFVLSAVDVIGEALVGAYNGINNLTNLDTSLQKNMAAAPFVHILKTSRFNNDFALRGSNKVLDSAKYFNLMSIQNSANTAVDKYNNIIVSE